MNEKELRRLLVEKQKEMEAAQREYEQAHYSRQLSIFGDTFSKSPDVLKLIQSEELTPDDCRLLAGIMSKHIRGIYKNFAEKIEQNKEHRQQKNASRRKRRSASSGSTTTASVRTTSVDSVPQASPAITKTTSNSSKSMVGDTPQGRQY